LYHFALNLGLAQYVGFQSGFSFNAPSWSISTEFWVNVLFFIVISIGWKRLFPISLGIAVVSLALVVTTGNGSLGAANTVAYPAITLIRTAFGFFVGVALHEVAFREPRTHASSSLLFDAVFIAVIALLIWGALGHLSFHPRLEVLSVLVAFPLLLLTASRSVLVKQTLRLSPLTFLGDISFSIYLLHFPLQLLLHVFVVGGWVALDFQSGWVLLLFLGITIGMATFSYYLVELPAQRAVNRWWAVRSKPKP
jgi:peptidoglycan/LPS O-acetylase OafA/YrhL